MKKIALLLFLTSSILFTSCDKDDDSVSIEIDETLIPGEWDLTALNVENGKTITITGDQRINESYTSFGKNFELLVSFSDSSFLYSALSYGVYTSVITTTFSGESTTKEVLISDFLPDGKWNTEGNLLIITKDGVSKSFEILELSQNTIRLKTEINETKETLEGSITTTGTMFSTLQRK